MTKIIVTAYVCTHIAIGGIANDLQDLCLHVAAALLFVAHHLNEREEQAKSARDQEDKIQPFDEAD